MHVDPHVVEVEGGAVEDLINVIIVIVLVTQQENAEAQDRIITAEDTAEVDILGMQKSIFLVFNHIEVIHYIAHKLLFIFQGSDWLFFLTCKFY